MASPRESGHLDVDGVRLEYAWFGPGPQEAPTLVFLHEGLGCVAMWRDFPAQAVQDTGCGALVYSRVGYGASDPVEVPRPLTYMHIEAREVLPRVLDVAGVRRCLLVGHSDGASIALIYVGSRADPRVEGIAALAPHVFNEKVCVESIAKAREAYESGDLRRRLQRYHGENVDCAFWGWNRAWLDPDFRHWNIEEFLANIRLPVLIIQGQNDQYATYLQVDAIERQVSGPVETVSLHECRHSPHLEQPEFTEDALARFAERVLQLESRTTATA